MMLQVFQFSVMFLSILLGQFGFFLALPSVFTAVCLAVGVVVIIRQAMAEERALAAHFGVAWHEYEGRTRRWL